jgi:hypothetical protein
MTPTERKTIKAGKHERIKALLRNIRPLQPRGPVVEEQPFINEAVGLPRRRSTQPRKPVSAVDGSEASI